MKLPARLVRLFDCPVDDILAVLPPSAAALWDLNRHRQEKHAVHRATRSIIFDWIDDRWQPGQPASVQHFDHPAGLATPVYACAERLNARIPGKIVRLMLTELAPRGRIAPHMDGGAGVVLVHRLHLPVVSNPEVKFFIDEIPHYLEPGVAYEFDNTRRHAVDNDSDAPRIHLMCDVLPPALVA
jgi:hypothetical protein